MGFPMMTNNFLLQQEKVKVFFISLIPWDKPQTGMWRNLNFPTLVQ
jgi:hypothetical protein